MGDWPGYTDRETEVTVAVTYVRAFSVNEALLLASMA